MKRNKKMTLAALASLMLVTSGCGNAGNSTEGSAAGTGNAGTKETTPVPIKIMANYTKPEPTASDKKFIAELEALNNVKLTFEVPPATGYNERLQLMLASGDYPDVVFFPSSTDQSFQNAVKDGIIKPVNDYLKNAPNLQKYTYPASWDQLKINQDDKIYGIPRTSVVRNDGYWVRKDWLDNIGFPIPANSEITLAQFEEILNKFTNGDPDRNGKKDTYGYAGAYNAQKMLEVIVPGSFGLTGWQATSGGKYTYMNPVYDQTSGSFKQALEFTSKLYKNGYFDPDSATNDATKQRERFVRGLTGVYPGFAGHYAGILSDIQKNTPNGQLTYLFVKNEKGEVKGGSIGASSTGLWGFWAVTTSAKNPQKIIDVLDSWLSDKMWTSTAEGYEGLDYAVVDGQKTTSNPPAEPSYFRRSTMRRSNDVSFFLSVDMSKPVRDLVTPWLEKSIKTVVPAKDIGFVPDAAKKPNFIDYTKVWDQTVMKIIMGAEPVTKFDELLAGWYKNGGEDYVKQMNDYIKKMESAQK